MESIKDPYGRHIDYMRISITDRCNLRCVYCMPSMGVIPNAPENHLTYEEITRVVKAASGLGVRKIRISGGEPLLRKDLHRLIESIRGIDAIEEIGLTTNGTLLKQRARSLADAGLDRVNVSLDSLDPGTFGCIRRNGNLDDVLAGIQMAEDVGLTPVKINMVVIRGVNDGEVEAFARLTLIRPYHVRFIELMQIGSGSLSSNDKRVPIREIMDRIRAHHPLVKVDTVWPGPAEYFRLSGARSLVGFIGPMARHFCASCNRLRLTCGGKLRPCLFSNREIDLKPVLRHLSSDNEISGLIKRAIRWKPQGREKTATIGSGLLKSMSQIGG